MVSRLFVVATALVFFAFGVWGLILPGQMMSRFGVDLTDPAGRTAIRAMYGGFLIGAGLLFGFCAMTQSRTKFGLQAILILSASILMTRIIGMGVDRSITAYHLTYALLETAGICVSATLLVRMRTPPIPVPQSVIQTSDNPPFPR